MAFNDRGRPFRGRDSNRGNRDSNRGRDSSRGGFGAPREMHRTKCSDCGVETEVPFKPDPERPVYCRECLPKHRKPREDRY
ncbi:MAG: CxxC-x17-CxxC domain-containing protein [Accumulibacter sp.]